MREKPTPPVDNIPRNWRTPQDYEDAVVDYGMRLQAYYIAKALGELPSQKTSDERPESKSVEYKPTLSDKCPGCGNHEATCICNTPEQIRKWNPEPNQAEADGIQPILDADDGKGYAGLSGHKSGHQRYVDDIVEEAIERITTALPPQEDSKPAMGDDAKANEENTGNPGKTQTLAEPPVAIHEENPEELMHDDQHIKPVNTSPSDNQREQYDKKDEFLICACDHILMAHDDSPRAYCMAKDCTCIMFRPLPQDKYSRSARGEALPNNGEWITEGELEDGTILAKICEILNKGNADYRMSVPFDLESLIKQEVDKATADFVTRLKKETEAAYQLGGMAIADGQKNAIDKAVVAAAHRAQMGGKKHTYHEIIEWIDYGHNLEAIKKMCKKSVKSITKAQVREDRSNE